MEADGEMRARVPCLWQDAAALLSLKGGGGRERSGYDSLGERPRREVSPDVCTKSDASEHGLRRARRHLLLANATDIHVAPSLALVVLGPSVGPLSPWSDVRDVAGPDRVKGSRE